MQLNDKYIKLLKTTNDTNGIFEIEYEYIRRLYEEKVANQSFLDPRNILQNQEEKE